MLMHATANGDCANTITELELKLTQAGGGEGGENPLLHQGVKPASAAAQQIHQSTIKLHPHLHAAAISWVNNLSVLYHCTSELCCTQ